MNNSESDDYSTIAELLRFIENKETEFLLVYKGKQGGVGIYNNGNIVNLVGLLRYAAMYLNTVMGNVIDEQINLFTKKIE